MFLKFIYDSEYGSDYSEDLNTSNKIKTIKIRIVSYCKESRTEKDVVIKTLPITMTLHRLKELGKRLFSLGSKMLEFSYFTKEVNFFLISYIFITLYKIYIYNIIIF